MNSSDLEKSINHPDTVIIDLREFELYQNGHIPGAINVPFYELQNRLAELDPNKHIILVSDEDGKGDSSSEFLIQEGYQHVSNLLGGMENWAGELEK
ncbi:hypothetical protein AM500_02710 [Bacillus sp. FJAT-18017]|nr:hypothetical protein AM500_02710 [Bacillus sp. FJAT-18017]